MAHNACNRLGDHGETQANATTLAHRSDAPHEERAGPNGTTKHGMAKTHTVRGALAHCNDAHRGRATCDAWRNNETWNGKDTPCAHGSNANKSPGASIEAEYTLNGIVLRIYLK